MIVEFDQDFIVKEVFPHLVDRYFSALGAGEYRVAVMTRSEPRRLIYPSDTSMSPDDFSAADFTTDLFEFRSGGFMQVGGQIAFGIRGNRTQFTFAVPPAKGHWQLLVEHRLGSLDAAADRLRRRNLAVSFDILVVLIGSVVMIIIASERARVLARLQMKFAAGVSHELRTPLAVIQALAHNLTAGIIKGPAEIEQYARMLQDEARGLSSMVDQVLLFAEAQSMRSMRKKYDVGPVEVVEVLDHGLAALTSQIRESGCEVITEIPDDLPLIRANAASLTHCVRNLVSNALKYGNSSSKSAIHITARRQNAEVRISVIDHGSGIDPADWPHIFKAFYRGNNVSPGTRGAGLGLYLVKHLIEAQGGRITVETGLGTGTTFVLHIPVFDGELRHGSAAVSG